MSDAVGVGVIGAGAISGQYLSTLARASNVRVVAVADLVADRAVAAAARVGARAMSPDALLRADDVELVLNLTVPAVHAAVTEQALSAGKDVYSEKPLAADFAAGAALLSGHRSPRLGCAPDTVLGVGIQTARKAVDDGLIGQPVAAAATFLGRGPDRNRHPNPGIFFQRGAGPLHDMSPYFVTALVTLLGPIASVSATASCPPRDRLVRHGPLAGSRIDVEVPTHVAAAFTHVDGLVSTLIASYEAAGKSRAPRLEVFGTDATLSAGDPNHFADLVEYSVGDDEWRTMPTSAGYRDAGRGIGLIDMTMCRAAGRPHRASAELALHVLDVLDSTLRAAATGQRVSVLTSCRRPDPVPLTEGTLVDG